MFIYAVQGDLAESLEVMYKVKLGLTFFPFLKVLQDRNRGLERIKALSVLNLSSEKKNPASALLRHTLPSCSLAFGNIV